MSSPPPVSLGKPSLRHRLVSYYSLIAPDAIADEEKWKKNFEIIYNKYGGTVEGETKLAAKLAKKYGNRVRLLVAPPHRSMQRQLQRSRLNREAAVSASAKHDESYYGIDEVRKGSKVLDFTSARFDALFALNAPEGIVMDANPTIFTGSMAKSTKLDNISKFRSFLPKCDPQRLEPTKIISAPRKTDTASNPNVEEVKKKKPPIFLSMASRYESKNSGPLSLLYSIVANRQRARVMVRYVDCIRGTLTGYLIAFDKHFNMILKDVDEVYSGRVTRHSGAVDVASAPSECGSLLTANHDNKEDVPNAPYKPKLEAQRRRCYPPDGSGGPGPAVKQRYFHQLLVRGDNVVMVWRAEAERSTHPRTNKSPTRSLYENSDDGGRNQTNIGTPGSLYYALQRYENKQVQKVPNRQKMMHR
ncbi:hypothetical protein ACHAXR_011764 [Thalassiosira sp. AJA248-18]